MYSEGKMNDKNMVLCRDEKSTCSFAVEVQYSREVTSNANFLVGWIT